MELAQRKNVRRGIRVHIQGALLAKGQIYNAKLWFGLRSFDLRSFDPGSKSSLADCCARYVSSNNGPDSLGPHQNQPGVYSWVPIDLFTFGKVAVSPLEHHFSMGVYFCEDNLELT